MPNTLAVVDDPLFEQHRAPSAHPERPERLLAARGALDGAELGAHRLTLPPRDASDDELYRVHTARYVELLDRTAGKAGYYDPDTYYAPPSVAAARRAAGGAIAMTDALRGGEATHGLALLRPPGHHARPDGAMGFCLLNNAAVAAAHARTSGADRVVVVDWDVHHGNGTQEIFYADPSVLYVSLHQFPFYPGTGAPDEIGEGDGQGYTVNVALGAGAGDAVYAAAFDRIVGPIVEQYDPDLLLVSAGFDAHGRDPLAGMDVTDAGYAHMLRRLASALPRGTEGRLGMVLEGGYDLQGLGGALRATLEALGSGRDDEMNAPAGHVGPRHADDLDRTMEALRPHWRFQ